MQDIDVAIIIVSYRTARLTIEALRSLLLERATPNLRIRATVIDNASGDLPEIERAVLEQGWSDWVDLVAAPKNGGFAYGNNIGIERAYARAVPSYVYLLNPDAEVRPGAIPTLVRFLEEHPAVGIVGSSFEYPDGTEWPIAFRFPSVASELIQGLEFGLVSRLLRRWEVARQMDPKTAQPVDWVGGASMMIRPAVFDAIGGLDENYFLYFEETDFCQRARRAGFSTWYVPQSRVMHLHGHISRLMGKIGTPTRAPTYWFDSRRRYFAMTFGVGKAILIDVVAVLANSLGWLKRVLLRRRHTAIPHFTRDLIRSSVLWPRNRRLPALRSRRTPERRGTHARST